MKVVFDESGFLMKVVFDENVFDENDHFHPNFDESVPNLYQWGKGSPHIPFLRLTITRNTSSGNTVKKPITGPIWGPEGQRKIVVDKCSDS